VADPIPTQAELSAHRWWGILLAGDFDWLDKDWLQVDRRFQHFRNIDAATEWADDVKRWVADPATAAEYEFGNREQWALVIIDGKAKPPKMQKAYGIYEVQASIAWNKKMERNLLGRVIGWDAATVAAFDPKAAEVVKPVVRKRAVAAKKAPAAPASPVAARKKVAVAKTAPTPTKAPAARKRARVASPLPLTGAATDLLEGARNRRAKVAAKKAAARSKLA
jgi:hypothetical protein